MKLNSNTKRVLLFAALLLAAYLISLAFGGKDPAPQDTRTSVELETGVLEPESTEAGTESVTEAELVTAETLPEPESMEEAEAETPTEEEPAEEETEEEPAAAVTTEEKPTEKETTKAAETSTEAEAAEEETEKAGLTVERDGQYYDKDHVALYIHTYGYLPSNYISKKDAQALGWPGGSLEAYAPGKAIGGDYFGNYEGLLPKKKGRKYYECDIDTKGRGRGAKRIIYSNDGLIFYTDDHYESFTQLYGGY